MAFPYLSRIERSKMELKSAEGNKFKAGYAAIVGKPNVGKSTLINAYLGEKVSIVSPRPQTTRNRILGILTRDNFQIIFVDSPGIHKPRHLLGEYMLKEAMALIREVDVVAVMLDASSGIEEEDEYLLKLVASVPDVRKLLLLNKIDLVKKPALLPILDSASKLSQFEEYIPLSATKGENLQLLLDKIINLLPEGPPLYPQEQLTDKPERFHIAELIREKIILNTREEIPHSAAVAIEEYREIEEKDILFVRAVIYVERKTQKGIVIGEGGRMLKKIGQEARLEIESFLRRKVYLELWVKVYEKWRKNKFALRRLGYG